MATTVDTASSAAAAAAASAKAKTASALNDASSPDRFLKLLVAQMQNQDPLNPLDNAQVTSQMAQISTVSGIEKMNRSIGDMSASFAQMQQMTGTSLVGRDVLVSGDLLKLNAQGQGGGGYELERAVDSLKVEILSTNGTVIDTIDLGAQGAGRHTFDWTLKQGVNPATVAAFRVDARFGTQEVQADPLMRDRVQAVLMGGTQLKLELATLGNVPYADIKAFQ
jgi:flagellar basal-body rod modification protein FlgD